MINLVETLINLLETLIDFFKARLHTNIHLRHHFLDMTYLLFKLSNAQIRVGDDVSQLTELLFDLPHSEIQAGDFLAVFDPLFFDIIDLVLH